MILTKQLYTQATKTVMTYVCVTDKFDHRQNKA